MSAGSLARLLLMVRTARHLRWEQVWYRPFRRLQGLWPTHLPADDRLGPAVDTLRDTLARWGPGAAATRLASADAVLECRFSFLGREVQFERIDWTERHVSHLWTYNLHYFAYAEDLAWAWRQTGDGRYVSALERLVQDWVANCPPGRGDGWEPYAVSMRIVHWTRAWLLAGEAMSAAASATLRSSLYAQCTYLASRLEHHLLANHLQKNFHALALGGLLLGGPAAARWRRAGVEGTWNAVREQVLDDGCHYERSPMYHAAALADVLEVIGFAEAAGMPAPADIRERVGRMVTALGVLGRPDGRLHLFNDTALHVAPTVAVLDALGRAVLGRGVEHAEGSLALARGGFFGVIAAGQGHRLLIDAGEPGPSYQPAHAHAGIFGFELDLDGIPVIADSGLHGYEGDPWRAFLRSTSAHSTLAVDGLDQAELWGTFRMARRPRVLEAEVREERGAWLFNGAVQPYHRRGTHRRVVRFADGACEVVDCVVGAVGRKLESFLHFHPDLEVGICDGGLTARGRGRLIDVRITGVDRIELLRGATSPYQGWFCPTFGTAQPRWTAVLVRERNDGRALSYTIRSQSSGGSQ